MLYPLLISASSLGLAYAGTHRADLLALLSPILADGDASMEVLALTSLSLGFIFVGSCNGDIAGLVLQTIMEKVRLVDHGYV